MQPGLGCRNTLFAIPSEGDQDTARWQPEVAHPFTIERSARRNGEFQEQRLSHREEAERFYRDLAAQGMKGRVGMEASGHARWFERLLAELKVELWRGDAAKI